MLIPKSLLNLHRAASEDAARYQIHGVRFTRRGEHEGEAVATSGKVLLRARWREDPAEEFPQMPGAPPVNGVTWSQGQGVTIDTLDCKAALRAAPKYSPKPVLENVVLGPEHDGLEPINLVSTDLDTTSVIRAKPVQGSYPQYESVCDSPELDINLRLNPVVLLDLLETMIAASGRTKAQLRKEPCPVMRVHIPAPDHKDKVTIGRPVRLEWSPRPELTLDGFAMPLINK